MGYGHLGGLIVNRTVLITCGCENTRYEQPKEGLVFLGSQLSGTIIMTKRAQQWESQASGHILSQSESRER